MWLSYNRTLSLYRYCINIVHVLYKDFFFLFRAMWEDNKKDDLVSTNKDADAHLNTLAYKKLTELYN